jgi:stage V sporulation protein AC
VIIIKIILIKEEKMKLSEKQYDKMVKKATPPSRIYKTWTGAFLCGGAICLLGEWINQLISYYISDEKTASLWTLISLIFLSITFTSFGLYKKIAKFAGAGTLVPITGFANGISSCAIEAKSEGFIIGVGAKIFQIAGPVILYGTAASVIYGFVYYLIKCMS